MYVRNVSKSVLVCCLLSLAALAQKRALSIPSTGFSGLDQYRASRIAIYTDDFGELKRYRADDAALALPAAKEKRVVFSATPSPTTGSWRTIFRQGLRCVESRH
jgi:hypothetical protein